MDDRVVTARVWRIFQKSEQAEQGTEGFFDGLGHAASALGNMLRMRGPDAITTRKFQSIGIARSVLRSLLVADMRLWIEDVAIDPAHDEAKTFQIDHLIFWFSHRSLRIWVSRRCP